MTCADCGKRVFPLPRPDGSIHYFSKAGRFGRSFVCRIIELQDDVIVEADYHHLAGEPQRHFPSVEGEYAR